jgi:radical SAM superfamily enzyme YgiQ (UPF0313 family)
VLRQPPPDHAAIVYSQRCREAFKDVPIVLGGIEGALRRIAHYDYWSDKVRRSIVVDAKCDLLLYGNADRAIVEIAHRLAAREPVQKITDVRGTAFVRRTDDESARGRPMASRAGSRSIPPAWTSPAVWKPTSTPTRPPANRRRAGQQLRQGRRRQKLWPRRRCY